MEKMYAADTLEFNTSTMNNNHNIIYIQHMNNFKISTLDI